MAIINGNLFNNTLNGTSSADTLNGLGGNDTLNGGAGDDVLDGGTGNDRLIGGTGNDTYYVDVVFASPGFDTVVENANEGIDLVYSSTNITSLWGNVENLTLTGGFNLSGAGNSLNNVIRGNDGNNSLDGLGGDDLIYGGLGDDGLNGGTGADTLIGGVGNDFYTVDSNSDVVIENAGEGKDTVSSKVASYALGANVENLVLFGVGVGEQEGFGNGLNNEISSLAQPGLGSYLYGLGGNDTLLGGQAIGTEQSDYLVGGRGNDSLAGFDGSDTYFFNRGDGQDVVDDVAGSDDDISFAVGIDKTQLWFTHVGNDLKVATIGTTDSVTVKDWYLGASHQVENFYVLGNSLSNTKVEALVQAQAQFAQPTTTTLPSNYATALAPVLAASWA